MSKVLRSLLDKTLLHLLLIAILGILVYSNTFNVPFQFDDSMYIIDNPIIKDLSYFTEPSKIDRAIKLESQVNTLLKHTFRSRFIGYLTFAMNYKLHGLDVTGFHIFNLTIHILNAILVYFLIALTFKTPYFKVSVNSVSVISQSHLFTHSPIHPFTYLPLFVAILFVSHPIQTQAVTYITQRFTSLATTFYLLSIVMYIKYRLQVSGVRCQSTSKEESEVKMQSTAKIFNLKSGIWYLASILSAILAMKTKEIAFTLPIIITLYEFMFFKGETKRGMLFLTPFLLTMFITPLSRVRGDSISTLDIATKELTDMSRWDYLFTQFRAIVTYIRLLFLPINQNIDYDYPIYHSLLNLNVFLSFLFLLSIFSIGVYLLYRSRFTVHGSQSSNLKLETCNLKLISFGIFWFFITLSVESSVIPIVDVIFEHRIYLPSVGAIITFSTAIFYVLLKFYNSRFIASRITPNILRITLVTGYLLFATLVAPLSIATYTRNTVWQDEVRLWEDVVKKSPQKTRGYNNLGNAYKNKGWVDKAIKHYQRALNLNPYYAEAYNNLGSAYYAQGRLNEAISEYKIALKLSPNLIKVYYNLGNAYRIQGRLDEAVYTIKIALTLKPDYAEAHNIIGAAYAKQGRLNEAIRAFQTALTLKPDFIETHYNLGLVYGEMGHWDKAIQAYTTSLKLNPNYVKAYNDIGLVYMKNGLVDKAIEQFQTAIRLNPESEIPQNNLNMVLQLKGN